MAELVRGDIPVDDNAGQNDEDDEMRKVDGIFPTGLGPDGALLKRNNSDFMNNFFINYCVRSFTNIDQVVTETRNNGQGTRLEKFKKELEQQKQRWDRQIIEAYNENSAGYFEFVRRNIGQ